LEALDPLLRQVTQGTDETSVKPADNNSSFNTRATTFLTNLSDLPQSNLRLILKSLSAKELSLLFAACRSLAITRFFTQLQSILPEKNYQQLESKQQARFEEAQLRNLLAKLNQELKDLKQLLKNRKK